jgi:oxepin-CoA hydrolase / 3-oxo-5,6-dehydrosuberyl-CoA semialdehyde dehydrogenase
MTVPLVESYVAGRWYAAPDEGTPLLDAVTSEPVARISSTGLDVRAMLDHALSADQRCVLSRRTGATDQDSGVDVDGGFGTQCASGVAEDRGTRRR